MGSTGPEGYILHVPKLPQNGDSNHDEERSLRAQQTSRVNGDSMPPAPRGQYEESASAMMLDLPRDRSGLSTDVARTPSGVVSASWQVAGSTLSMIPSEGGGTLPSLLQEDSSASIQKCNVREVDLSTETVRETKSPEAGIMSKRRTLSSQGSIQSGQDLVSPSNNQLRRKRRRTQQSNYLLRVIFGIGPPTFGYSGSKLIHPNSAFAWMMTIISTLLLAFVAIVTPIIIGFFWDAPPCVEAPTLKIDIAVECFFIFEIMTKFFTGIYHQGVYVDDWPFVVWRYVKGDFLFDIITSVPAGIVEYISIQSCNAEDGGDGSRELRMVRFLKGFRLIKMLRVLKTSSLVHAVQYMESIVKPPMVISRIFKLIMSILLIVHFATCFYWLVKVEWRYSGSIDALEELKDAVYMPDNPSLGDKYIVSMYFINTVFATVGFGDISALNNAERVYTVIIMYVGTLVFGAMLGEVQNIMDSLRKADRERTLAVQETKDYLRSHQAPPEVERQMLSWVYFNEDVRLKDEQRFAVWSRFPDTLMYSLASHLHKDLLLKVGAFRSISEHKQSEGFLLDLFQSMESVTFCADHAIGQAGHPADCMYYVVSGAVRVTVPHADKHGSGSVKETVLATLNPGDVFGEYSLFEDATWQTSMGTSATFWTMSHVHVKALPRERFLDVLALYDEDLEEQLMAWAANDRAFRRRVGATKQTIPQMRWCQLLWKVLTEVRTQMENEGASAFFRLGKKMQFKTLHGRVLNKRKSSMKRSVQMLDADGGARTNGDASEDVEEVSAAGSIGARRLPDTPSSRSLNRPRPARLSEEIVEVSGDEGSGEAAGAGETQGARVLQKANSTNTHSSLSLRRMQQQAFFLGEREHAALLGAHADNGDGAGRAGVLDTSRRSQDHAGARRGSDVSHHSMASGDSAHGMRFVPRRTISAEKSGPKSYMRGMIAASFKGSGGTPRARLMHGSSFSTSRSAQSSFRSTQAPSMLGGAEVAMGVCGACGAEHGRFEETKMLQINDVVCAAEQRLEEKLQGMVDRLGRRLMERMETLEALSRASSQGGGRHPKSSLKPDSDSAREADSE